MTVVPSLEVELVQRSHSSNPHMRCDTIKSKAKITNSENSSFLMLRPNFLNKYEL